MADNVKEVTQTPPPPQFNSDDNRRRTRSQTRNGGVTPPVPVLETRGRKRGSQSQPGSGKRGRKPAIKPAEVSGEAKPEVTEKHSDKAENQDLSKPTPQETSPVKTATPIDEVKDEDKDAHMDATDDKTVTAPEVKKKDNATVHMATSTEQAKKPQAEKEIVEEKGNSDSGLESKKVDEQKKEKVSDDKTSSTEDKKVDKTIKESEKNKKVEDSSDAKGVESDEKSTIDECKETSQDKETPAKDVEMKDNSTDHKLVKSGGDAKKSSEENGADSVTKSTNEPPSKDTTEEKTKASELKDVEKIEKLETQQTEEPAKSKDSV